MYPIESRTVHIKWNPDFISKAQVYKKGATCLSKQSNIAVVGMSINIS